MRSTIWFACFAMFCSAAHGDAVSFEAGFGKADATPSEPVRLSGYGNRSHASEGVDTPLHARALALRADGGETFVLVSFDTIGTPANFTDDVFASLQKKHGIARERFVHRRLAFARHAASRERLVELVCDAALRRRREGG